MDINQVLAPTINALETARLKESATLSMVKDSIEFQGRLALQLIPEPPRVDPTSPLGQTIDLYV